METLFKEWVDSKQPEFDLKKFDTLYSEIQWDCEKICVMDMFSSQTRFFPEIFYKDFSEIQIFIYSNRGPSQACQVLGEQLHENRVHLENKKVKILIDEKILAEAGGFFPDIR